MATICCFFNYNPLHRYPIYEAMGERYDIDFYFGNTVFESIKQFDATTLKGFKGFLKTKKVFGGSFLWHESKGVFNKSYNTYIITGDSSSILNWRLLLYCKMHHKKIYAWTHGIKDYESQNRKGLFLNKLFFRNMTGILMYNRHSCSNMLRLGCKEPQLLVIHNSLDTQQQTHCYNSLQPSTIYQNHFNNNDPTAVYIGRLQKRKKLDQLIDAAIHLNSNGFAVNLVIIGKEADDETIDTQILQSGIQNRIWKYGPCFEETKNAELLYNASVFVCPAEVGLSCIHALSYGTPVVTNNNFPCQMPEFEAISDGVTGSFYVENDIEDLAANIKHWCSVTTEEREIIRKQARKMIIEEWSVKYQVSVLDKILKS